MLITPKSNSRAVAVACNGPSGKSRSTTPRSSDTGGTSNATALGGVVVRRPRELPVRTVRAQISSAIARSIS